MTRRHPLDLASELDVPLTEGCPVCSRLGVVSAVDRSGRSERRIEYTCPADHRWTLVESLQRGRRGPRRL